MDSKPPVSLPTFPCNHCGRNLLVCDDLEFAIYLYGIFFLEGNDDGFIGTTCPSCVKTTYCRFGKMEFDRIVERCGTLVFQANPHPDSLRYFSPYASSPESIPDRYKFVTKYGSHVFDGEVHLSLQEMWPDDEPELYHTYIYKLGPCMGSYFYNLWMSDDQIQKLLSIENEQLTSMLPRYMFKSELLKEIERFCWIYKYQEAYFKKENEYFRRFDSTPLIDNNSFDISYDFHNILTTRPNPWLGKLQNNKAIVSAWKQSGPFFGAELLPIRHEKTIESYGVEELDENIFDVLKENFSKEYSQFFLTETAKPYIEEYTSIIDQPNWSYLDIWELNNRYINNYYKAIKFGISNEHPYAFYENGGTWTIIFDGKPITGLDHPGFILINYLILNENTFKDHWDLLAHEAMIRRISIWEGGDVDTDLYEGDDELDNYSKKFESNNIGKNKKYNEELQLSYYIGISKFKDSHGKTEIVKNAYDDLKNRNGITIKRARNQLKSKAFLGTSKHIIEAERHFKSSIKGPYSNNIAYIANDENIKWYLDNPKTKSPSSKK